MHCETVIGTYTGNGTTQTITLGFRPKFVKIRSVDGIYDVTNRGTGSTFGLIGVGMTLAYRHVSVPTGGITITNTGFEVGNSASVNGSGIGYEWEVV